MSQKNFLDKTGTLYFLVKIKNFIAGNYVAKDGDKVLSENDFTDAAKSKLDAIETGATRTEIDDTTFALNKVWSSSKVNTELAKKQNTLIPGDNIKISNNIIGVTGLPNINDENISNYSVWSSGKTSSELADKQNLLIAGDRINISNDTISASSEISDSSASITSTYSSSKVETLLANKQNTLTAGTNIDITGDVISVTGAVDIDDSTTSSSTTWSSNKITSELSSKQDTLTAGTRVSISNENVIDVSSEINDSSTTSSNTWSASKIMNLISSLERVTIAIVQTLPTQDISNSTIYFVPKSTSQTTNYYDEYIYVNNAWEKIGDTTIDLSGYVKDEDLVPITNQEIDAMFV